MMQIIRSIQNRIYELRGERIMLDRDLAALYKIETTFVNLAVSQHIKNFPEACMFQLTKEEFDALRFQIETLENNNPLRLQHITSAGKGGTNGLPYAFTAQGVAMLNSILNPGKVITTNIATAMENLRDEKAAQRKWDERERIGFKKDVLNN